MSSHHVVWRSVLLSITLCAIAGCVNTAKDSELHLNASRLARAPVPTLNGSAIEWTIWPGSGTAWDLREFRIPTSEWARDAGGSVLVLAAEGEANVSAGGTVVFENQNGTLTPIAAGALIAPWRVRIAAPAPRPMDVFVLVLLDDPKESHFRVGVPDATGHLPAGKVYASQRAGPGAPFGVLRGDGSFMGHHVTVTAHGDAETLGCRWSESLSAWTILGIWGTSDRSWHAELAPANESLLSIDGLGSSSSRQGGLLAYQGPVENVAARLSNDTVGVDFLCLSLPVNAELEGLQLATTRAIDAQGDRELVAS